MLFSLGPIYGFDGVWRLRLLYESLQILNLLDGGECVAQGLLRMLNCRMVFVGIFGVVHQVQRRLENVLDIEDRRIGHSHNLANGGKLGYRNHSKNVRRSLHRWQKESMRIVSEQVEAVQGVGSTGGLSHRGCAASHSAKDGRGWGFGVGEPVGGGFEGLGLLTGLGAFGEVGLG